jgi:hypothetical protein
MISQQQLNVLYKLYPNVIRTVGDTAYDADGNEVTYDLAAVEAKAEELQAKEAAAIQAQADAKQSALNKLMALGLTEEEALALGNK